MTETTAQTIAENALKAIECQDAAGVAYQQQPTRENLTRWNAAIQVATVAVDAMTEEAFAYLAQHHMK